MTQDTESDTDTDAETHDHQEGIPLDEYQQYVMSFLHEPESLKVTHFPLDTFGEYPTAFSGRNAAAAATYLFRLGKGTLSYLDMMRLLVRADEVSIKRNGSPLTSAMLLWLHDLEGHQDDLSNFDMATLGMVYHNFQKEQPSLEQV